MYQIIIILINKLTTIILYFFKFIIYSLGIPALTVFSIPHSLLPLIILKKPPSPHSSFHELAHIQHLTPFSTPYPIILIACPPCAEPVTC